MSNECQSCHKDFESQNVDLDFPICPKCSEFHEDGRVNYATGNSESKYKKEDIPTGMRWEVWERDDFTCNRCGSRRYLTIDHIYPEIRGGKTEMDNLQTLCKSCNSSKKDKV